MDGNIPPFLLFLPGYLIKYESRTDYPYGAIFLHGALGDNMILGPELAAVGAEWNKRYTYPQIIFCTNDAFFKYIQANYDVSKLPVVRGSTGTCWEDGATSSAQETRQDRNSQEMLTISEKHFSLLSCVDPKTEYPQDDFNQAWRNCLLNDEHPWGARGSVARGSIWHAKVRLRARCNPSPTGNGWSYHYCKLKYFRTRDSQSDALQFN